MLELEVPGGEVFNEVTSEITSSPGFTLRLEHSLKAIQAWESKWKVSFIDGGEKTSEQVLDYIRCMSDRKLTDEELSRLDSGSINRITSYISDSMTATTFRDSTPSGARREKITAEIVYYWMLVHQIPMECANWHINQLLTLIRVANVKSQKQSKVSERDVLQDYAAINAKRRAMAGRV